MDIHNFYIILIEISMGQNFIRQIFIHIDILLLLYYYSINRVLLLYYSIILLLSHKDYLNLKSEY